MQRRKFLLLPGLIPFAAGCEQAEEKEAVGVVKAVAGRRSSEDPLLQITLSRHGDSLTPDEIEQLRLQIVSLQHAAARLRSFPLENADEPVLAPSSRYVTETKS